ncbi:lipoxygenase family protein [Shewanella surugensis]|uniref:Lipoxygenase domain-containing protein n=1 Tax=Shewanella surugensis TaxID=212020 RepID=A0ABT0LJ50_9GAMM|nr:lipoxygenase family protein [Shewanella surugensis]MCL1127485.1 hypothetical protein [Shewanella surugensis]
MMSINLPQGSVQPSLPQNDTPAEQVARSKALGLAQEKYILSTDNSLGLPLLKTPLPPEEAFDERYKAGRGVATLPMVTNSAKVTPQLTDPYGPFPGLADYESMYIDIEQPRVTPNWLTDESFGEQRLSGVNPVMLERVTDKNSFPGKLDLTQLNVVIDSSINIDQLILDKRLYIVDFTPYLDGVQEGSVPTPDGPIQKYLPKPIGLFYWNKEGAKASDSGLKAGRLLPLAIQVDIDGGQVKTFSPQSPELLWTIAKICFSIADSNVHEMSTHLGRAHFAQESFGAVTPMHLAPQHPLNILLKPHLRFLVVNNQAGVELLIPPSGPVDQLLAATLEGSLGISVAAAESWSVAETFPESIRARGLESKESLPHYPYRDDANLIWEAVVSYVKEYVNVYYKTEQDITGDYELQAWANKLADTGPEGGHIKGMPSQIDTIEQLSKFLAVIIFQNSAGHSSINFTQYPYIGFSPNMPLAGYSDYRKFLAEEGSTEKEQLDFMLNFLPPQALAQGQIEITFGLSIYHYDSLGDYARELSDPLAKHALYRFSQSLSNIEQRIEKRNRLRSVPYKYLLPSEVLNSASI